VGRQLRESGSIQADRYILGPKFDPVIISRIDVEVPWQSVWTRVITEDLKEEARYTIAVRDYKRYWGYFRWAKCGPRWCGEINNGTRDCPHGTVLWLD
jgi:hypothetical protein